MWVINQLPITMTESLIDYITYRTTDGGRSVDTHCLNRVESTPLSRSPIMAAYTSPMNVCNQFPLRFTKMQGLKSLTLRTCLFSEWGREQVSFSCAYISGLLLIYECLHPIPIQITQDARWKIVDTQLTLIFSLRPGAYLSCFWL